MKSKVHPILYLYGYKGRVYHGRYGCPLGHPNFHTWIFRTQPLLNGTFHLGTHKVHVAGTVVTLNGECLGDIEGECFNVSQGKVTQLHGKGGEKSDFVGWFKNRLREFAGQKLMLR